VKKLCIYCGDNIFGINKELLFVSKQRLFLFYLEKNEKRRY